MQAIILAIMAALSFPFGLIIGVLVGVLAQDLRSMKNNPASGKEMIACPFQNYQYNSSTSLADDR